MEPRPRFFEAPTDGRFRTGGVIYPPDRGREELRLSPPSEPALQRRIEILDDAREAVAARALRLLPHPVLEPVETLLAHPPLAGFEPISEELEALAGLAAIAHMRLVRVEGQSIGLDPVLHLRKCALRFIPAAAQDDEVVRVPHHAITFAGKPLVQWMQINVRQQRTDHRALRRSFRRRPSLQTIEDVLFKPRPQ